MCFCSYPVSPQSSILVAVLMNFLPGINMRQMFFKWLTLGYIVYTPDKLYHVFVLPVLYYCDVVWTTSSSSVQHLRGFI